MKEQQMEKSLPHETHTRVKSTKIIYLMSLNMTLGLFVLGFNQGIFNTVQQVLLDLYGITGTSKISLYKGILTSSNPIGGLIGSLFGSYYLRLVGKIRLGTIIIDILAIAFVFVEVSSNQIWVIIFGRFLLGITTGINTAICPIYVREFSPMEIAARTGSFNQLFQKTGLLVSYLLGYALPDSESLAALKNNGTPYSNNFKWRIILGVPVIASSLLRILILLIWFRIDTPTEMIAEHHEAQLKQFLHNVYRKEEEQKVLIEYKERELQDRLAREQLKEDEKAIQSPTEQREGNSVAPVSVELQPKQPISVDTNVQQPITSSTIEEDEHTIKVTRCRRTLLGSCISLAVSFSGIDAILYYSNTIFQNLKIGISTTTATVIIGAVCVFYTIIGLEFVNMTGRRTVVLTGTLIMTVALVAIVVAGAVHSPAAVLVGILFHLLGYNAAVGPIRWACYVELMEPFGVGLASSLIFVFAAIIGFIFPTMLQHLKDYGSFSIFLGLSVINLICLFFEMKETRYKTHMEIYRMFLKQHKKVSSPLAYNVHVLQLAACSHMHLKKKQPVKKIST